MAPENTESQQAPGLFARLGLVGLESIEPAVLASLATESPLLLIGAHGSAKSLLLERIADALGLAWRHYNASLVNFDDLVGYPLPDERGELRFVQTPASIWGAQAVFIDEISRARVDIQNRLFPIVHERRVQGIALPELRHRWAAMNPPAGDDEAGYLGSQPLDVALADRFALQVRMPDWRNFGEEEQEAVIRAHCASPDPQAGTDLARVLSRAREALPVVEAEWGRSIARYVRLLAAFLEKARLVISARRAGMLARNVAAVHAARLALDPGERLADSAWLATASSMPFAASSIRHEESMLLAAHKEAWRLAAVRPDDPMARILTERDPVRRVKLAVAATALPDGELTSIVTDALGQLPDGSRHALAEWIFESNAIERLSVVAADEASRAYRELACASRVSESVGTKTPRYKLWQALEARFACLDAKSTTDERTANLLAALFASKRITTEDEIDAVLGRLGETRARLAEAA